LHSLAATSSGDDVTVHVCTTRKLDFSYISGVALKIGDDVIEVKPNADLILNGQDVLLEQEHEIDGSSTMSGLPFAVVSKVAKGTR